MKVALYILAKGIYLCDIIKGEKYLCSQTTATKHVWKIPWQMCKDGNAAHRHKANMHLLPGVLRELT